MPKLKVWISVFLVVAVLGGGAAWTLRRSRGAPAVPPAVAAASSALREQTPAAAPAPSADREEPANSAAMRAVDDAAAKNRYAVITFYRSNDAASDTMRAAVQAQRARVASRAELVAVDRDDPANQTLVTRFGLEQAPVPITLVVAPNGAVTRGFPRELGSDVNLAEAFVSSGLAKALKIVQDGKLAIVCLQNGRTTLNKRNQTLASELAADPQLASISAVLTMDPADRGEADFYRQCGVTTGARKAQVLLLVPPGRVVGVFDGDTAKETVMTKIVSACSGGSCGPSGCGP
jgi:hypothetical protein